MTTKRVRTATAVIFATLGASATALAADMKSEYGSRVVGAYPAVPVPAPIPIPDQFSWYVRGDAGYSVKSQGSMGVSGPATILNSQPNDGPFQGSLGFGRYITPSLRAEFGIDLRNDRTIAKGGSYTFTRTEQVAPGPPPSIDTHTYLTDRQDNTNQATHTFMASAYYDLKTGTSFTPYVGAGAGLALTVTKRNYNETANCTKTVNSDTGAVLDAQGNPVCTAALQSMSAQDSQVVNKWGPAMSLMTGIAYQVTPGVSVDMGYRFMWQGTTTTIDMATLQGASSRIATSTHTDHELRMGVRWDIY